MNIQFSGMERHTHLLNMASKQLDLIVIGGGITGAGIALDGAKRGLDVGLVEMQDFAEGTSSRSTKLIHGGLRYLKQLEFRLVKEVGREREILYNNAPHLVKPEWMLLPVIKGGSYGRLATSAGLLLYDYLAGVKKHEKRIMLTKDETLQREPLLRKDNLLGAGYYVEYRTDDARLTLEVLKTAVELGASAVNYVKVIDLIYDNGIIAGVIVKELLSNNTYRLQAKKVINATGPWVDTIRVINGSRQGKRLHLTKGVHLVLDRRRAPLRQAIYFDTSDKRMIFAIPRGDKVYIGTTDSDYDGPPDLPEASVEDIEYLLNGANEMFPSLQLKPDDVESNWAGIRPLIHEDGKSPSELSRKDEIIVSNSNLISIAGGKLTGFRKMAERVINLVSKQLTSETGRSFPACTTDQIKLSGSRYDYSKTFAECSKEWVEYGETNGLSVKDAKEIVNRYGSNAIQIFDMALKQNNEAISAGLDSLVYAELLYGIQKEMVVKTADFLVRRTGDAYFDIKRYNHNYHAVSAVIASTYRDIRPE